MIRLLVLLCGLFAPFAFADLTVGTVGTITNNVPLAAANAALGALETSNGGTTTRYNTIASHSVFVGASLLKRIIVATTTVGTLQIWDDGDATCNNIQKTGTITPAAGAVIELGIETSSGICIVAGGTAIDFTVVYLP